MKRLLSQKQSKGPQCMVYIHTVSAINVDVNEANGSTKIAA